MGGRGATGRGPGATGRGAGPADAATLLSRLDPGAREIVEALRAMVRGEAPYVEETVLWGSLSWHRPAVGGRVRGAVCMATVKGGRVFLEFIHGVRLPDPEGLLEGDLRSKRSVTVPSPRAARDPALAALVRAAAALDPETWERRAPPETGAPRAGASPSPRRGSPPPLDSRRGRGA